MERTTSHVSCEAGEASHPGGEPLNASTRKPYANKGRSLTLKHRRALREGWAKRRARLAQEKQK